MLRIQKNLSHELINQSICKLRSRWLEKGEVAEISDINRAWCYSFAEELLWDILYDEEGISPENILGDTGKLGDKGVYYLANEYFWMFDDKEGNKLSPVLIDEDGDEYYPWNEEILSKFNITPPDGLSWEQMNQIALGYHVFIVYENRFFDAEVPEGVDNFFELPLYKSTIEKYIKEKKVSNSM